MVLKLDRIKKIRLPQSVRWHLQVVWMLLLLFSVGCTEADPDLPDPSPSRDYHLNLGNPSDAAILNHDNFLIEKPQYSLAYNCTEGKAGWVCWHLNMHWLGTTERQDNFRPDTTLPEGCYWVRTSDYTNTGFDRGHLCPSADRTGSVQDIEAKYGWQFFTKLSPQLQEYLKKKIDNGTLTGTPDNLASKH